MRRAAIILNVSRTTIARKLIFLAKLSREKQQELLKSCQNKIDYIQIDDLITSHHTKLKPLSVSVAINARDRKILAIEVSQIPAFGHLADISKRKYGHRENKLKEGLKKLFEQIKNVGGKDLLIESDEHKLYPPLVKKYFKNAEFKQYKSERACVVGQGELKRKTHDPIFKINHTLAMLRANINRLVRRTWCTTKDPKRLKNHLEIYMDFHNNCLV
jgi:hypothetical protein